MKKLLLTGIAALFLATGAANAADDDVPPPPPRPWQQVWQCNDIRVTITGRDPFSVEYDLGGTILSECVLAFCALFIRPLL